MTPEFENRIISSLIGAQWLFTHSTVETLYHEIIDLREKLEAETEACAKIADEFSTKGIPDYAIKTRIAQAIRLRTQNSTQDKRGGK